MLTSPNAGNAIQFIPQVWRTCRVVGSLYGMSKAVALTSPGILTATALNASGRGAWSVDLLGFAGHVVHEEILAEGVGGGEIGFAAAHCCDFLDEVDQGIIAGEHESVDHDSGALALVDFFEGLADDKGIEAESVLVDTAVFEGEGRGLSVGDHDDLAHVFFLAQEDALGHSKAFTRVGVIRADLDAREVTQGDVFVGVVEEDKAERVTRILLANEMRKRHGG